MADTPAPSSVVQIPVERLRLDWNNPRLPPELRQKSTGQDKLARIIEREYGALKVAESISRHEFFASEPLIAVPEGDHYVVIEGNRRLTAILGLTRPDLREQFTKENRGWSRLDTSKAPAEVPVVVVQDRSKVAPLLGFRHISGIEPWEPFAQAAFIADLVNSGQTFDEVSATVGRSTTEVRSMYRDYDILRFASDNGINIGPARDSFGVFNLAMGRPALRAFIGAPPPRGVDPDYEPISEIYLEPLSQFLLLLFGDTKGEGRAIHDSRQVSKLAKVFAEPSGEAVAVLLETRDLDEALAALDSPEERLLRSIESAARQLEASNSAWVAEKLPGSAHAAVTRVVTAVSKMLKRLP